MAKFSERRRYVLRVIQPSTRSTLSEYDSCPPLARYVWYVTWYLRSSCCSETHVRPRFLPVFLPLSTLDVTLVRRCTRPSPLYRTASDEKLGVGLGTRLVYMYLYVNSWSATSVFIRLSKLPLSANVVFVCLPRFRELTEVGQTLLGYWQS